MNQYKLSELVKWPEKMESYIECEPYCDGIEKGHNDAIDECDKTIEVDEEKLANIIQKLGKKWESYSDPITPLYYYLAQTIASNLKDIIKEVE